MEDLTPAMEEIGDELVKSTKKRFELSHGPDGRRWKPNAKSTILALIRKKIGSVANKKPLVVTGTLARTIFSEAKKTEVIIGSPMIYAGTQQFGAKKGEFGKTKRGGAIPWGDIPARKFLGISEEDRQTALNILRAHLEL
jgi:phage virion morphogenesis protein